MNAAVVLMAYGSPERLADVPAYYADIRGGRPIRPDLLDDLVERYRRLGIEDGSPVALALWNANDHSFSPARSATRRDVSSSWSR